MSVGTVRLRALLASAALVATSVSSPAYAYRPFDGTDAEVADEGELEVEVGALGLTRLSRATTAYTPSLVVNAGIAHSWELVLEGRPILSLSGKTSDLDAPFRVVDTGAFLKRVVREGALQGASGPSLAVELGTLLPELHDDSRLGSSAALIASEHLATFTTHLNLAGARTRDGGTKSFVGLIVEAPQSWRARPVLELATEAESGAAAPRSWSALEGVIVHVTADVTADFATRLVRVGDGTIEEVRAGLTCTLGVGASPQ